MGSPGAPIPDHRPDKLPGHSLSSFSAFVILAMTSSLGLREPLIEAYKLTVAQRALVGPSPSHGQTLGRAEPRTVLAEEFVRLKPCHPGTPPAVSACNALSNGWSKKSRYERYTAGSVIRRDRLTRSGTLPCTFLPVTHWAARAE